MRDFDWDKRVRKTPTAAQIEYIVEQYGWDVAKERWSHVSPRTLHNIRARGREETSESAAA